jgi:hypothetical protein
MICGTEFVDGKCPQTHVVKPMCLNCQSITIDGDEYRCNNDAVLGIAREKMLAALPEGYEIETLEIKPMLLKNPCKKCGKYTMDKTKVIRTLLEPSGLGIEDIEVE